MYFDQQQVNKINQAPNLLQRAAAHWLDQRFQQIHIGKIFVTDGHFDKAYGEHSPSANQTAIIRVTHPNFYSQSCFAGALGAAYSYGKGWWSTDDINELLVLFCKNDALAHGPEFITKGMGRLLQRYIFKYTAEAKASKAESFARRYRLGQDLWQKILGEHLQSYAAIFEHELQSLSDAEENSARFVVGKLGINANSHILEMNPNWGAFACYAAENTGCQLSLVEDDDEKYHYLQRRIANSEYGNNIKLYRSFPSFSLKNVSHVLCFNTTQLSMQRFLNDAVMTLQPGGKLFAQVRVLHEDVDASLHEHSAIRNHFFASDAPYTNLSGLLRDFKRLSLIEADDVSIHAEKTWRCWQQNLIRQSENLAQLGYDAFFQRLLLYYLALEEAKLSVKTLREMHLLFEKF